MESSGVESKFIEQPEWRPMTPQPASRRKHDDDTSAEATPLYAAAHKGHDAVVRALLDAGADKTALCRGKTAFDKAKTTEIKNLLR